jgi:hypothetical protein
VPRLAIAVLTVLTLVAAATSWVLVNEHNAAQAAQRLAVAGTTMTRAEGTPWPIRRPRCGWASRGPPLGGEPVRKSLVETLLASPYVATVQPGGPVRAVAAYGLRTSTIGVLGTWGILTGIT